MNTKLMAAVAVLLLAAPFSWAGGKKDQNAAPSAQSVPSDQSTPSTGAPAAQPAPSADPYRGKSITILPPRGVGLAANQAYLPDFVANELVSNFSGFSAMTLFDRVNNQRQYDELLSGYYADNDKAGLDLGHLTSTDYMLLGTITKTSTGYALQLTVNSNSDKTTAAAYSGTVSIADLDNLTGVRQASLDLFEKMGIPVTAQARTELTKAAAASHVNAQTALAQGITSQRGGTEVEALSRYIQASNYDPSLAEAASRLNILSANISSGNIGENVRNDIQWRNQWVARLKEAEAYFINYTKDPPPFYLVYSTNIEAGAVNYANETVSLKIRMSAIHDAPYFITVNRVMRTVRMGLIATGRIKEWNLDWPQTAVQTALPRDRKGNYSVVVEIVNSDGKSLGRQTVSLAYGWERSAGNISLLNNTSGSSYNDNRQIGQENTIYPVFSLFKDVVFPTANANLITDRMTIRVVSVDGVAAEAASAQKRVSILSEADYSGIASVRANGLDTTNLAMLDRNDTNRLNDVSFSPQSPLVIPYGVRNPIFSGNKDAKTEVIIPESVDAMTNSFPDGLTSIIIPPSVAYIRTSALDVYEREHYKLLTRVVIGENVNIPLTGSTSSCNFSQFAFGYNEDGKKAGTYTYVWVTSGIGRWTYTPPGQTPPPVAPPPPSSGRSRF
jgi:hypothetical protein